MPAVDRDLRCGCGALLARQGEREIEIRVRDHLVRLLDGVVEVRCRRCHAMVRIALQSSTPPLATVSGSQ